jgi:hypothetical protein
MSAYFVEILFSVYLGAPYKQDGDFRISGALMCQNVPFSVKRNNFRKKRLLVMGTEGSVYKRISR